MSIESVLSPITLTFLIIVVGYGIGKIKVLGISLDLAGILIAAVAAGYAIASCAGKGESETLSEIETSMKLFSALGTALFISVIGITTGYSLNFKQKKDAGAFLVGMVMVVFTFITMRAIGRFDKQVDASQLLGAFCGALTTTPGLSAACELENYIDEKVVLGYGCTYLFGVIFTILIVQVIGRKHEKLCEKHENTPITTSRKEGFEIIVQLGMAVVLGRMLGGIPLPVVDFSLGNAGGMLCIGIAVGFVVRRWLDSRCASAKVLGLFRNLGLVLFFVGTGIPAGMRLEQGWEMRTMVYGMLLTAVPIITGIFACKILPFQKSTATILAGGMTSTPAIGVLIQKEKEISLGQYSLSYAGALLTIVLLLRACG